MNNFSIIYERITEESAEHDEVEEMGYEMEQCSLKDALDFLRWKDTSAIEADSCPCHYPRWITWYGNMDMYTGDYINYSLHIPETATPSSRKRIAKLLKLK